MTLNDVPMDYVTNVKYLSFMFISDFKGFCTLKSIFLMSIFLMSIFFHNLIFKYVHRIMAYLKNKKFKNKSKILQRGVRNSTERPKIRRLRRKGYRKN